MNTVLYYFSATGNCLTTARILSRLLGNCEIVNVSTLLNQRKVTVEADRVGFVYPVYYGNMPWPVRDVVSRMVFRTNCYVFHFTTCRGHVGLAAQRLDQLLRTRGVCLSLARGIAMPGNSFLSTPEQTEQALASQEENIRRQAADILSGLREDNAPNELLPQTPIDYPNNFRGITADETCIGCGLCAKVCPMGNIRVENGKALIGQECTTCLACFHWCPQEAIWMPNQPEIARREKYRHPEVSAKDFLLR